MGKYNIGILGLGTVGSATVGILLDPVGRHPLLQDIHIKAVGVRDLDKVRSISISPSILTTDLQSIVTDPDIHIIVELIGGLEPARSLILTAISHGKHIVTANKAAIALYGDEIFSAANEAGVYVLLEAAVAGGIPVIKPLKEALGVNRIKSVLGIVNGTTNYILTQMTNAGASYEDVLAEAQKLGYAEADPTADVEGHDAADKIAILASIAFGGKIQRSDIPCEGISKVTAADIKYAEQLGFVIKLIAICQRHKDASLQVRVNPTLVPKGHPLASINGVFNAILIEAEPLGQVMFFGPGAGGGATGSAVVSDILKLVATLVSGNQDILDPLLSCSHQEYIPLTGLEETYSRFYTRFLTHDVPGVIGHLGTSFGTHQVSLELVTQIGLKDELAEIVVVTHYVREGNFREALKEIESLEAIKSIPNILRVL